MEVLRFENSDGYGPYVNNESFTFKFMRKHQDARRYPGLRQDEFNEEICFISGIKEFFCGFLDIKQARLWFTQVDIIDMYRKGFHLSTYKTDDEIYFSDKQVLFKKKDCNHTKEMIPFEKYMTKRTLRILGLS